MDQTPPTNPYSTEIPVSEVEKLHTVPPPPPSTQPVAPSPVMPPTPSRNHHKLLNFVMLAVIIIMASWVVILTLNKSTPSTPEQALPTPTIIPTATPTPTPEASTSADPTSNRFYSQELGIMFDYAKTISIQNSYKSLLVFPQNNRTYVYLQGTSSTNGQFVEVTRKISTDTITQALGKIISGNDIYTGCTVTSLTNTVYPPTYELASLTCPTGAGGSGFFLADSDHPDKLAYVSSIQSPLPASVTHPEVPWIDTIRFISSL